MRIFNFTAPQDVPTPQITPNIELVLKRPVKKKWRSPCIVVETRPPPPSMWGVEVSLATPIP